MNIEEARKHLKKNLNNWKKSKKDNGYMPEIIEEINTDYEAIETLLTAYEKEKEKNKRYEKYLKSKDKQHEQVLEYLETEKENEYISKDKIKAKIKVLEKLQKEFPNNDEIRIKIIGYKELLKEA